MDKSNNRTWGVRVWPLLLVMLLGGCSEPEKPVLEPLSVHRFTEKVVLSTALSDNADTVAILTDDRQVDVWDNQTKQLRHSWKKADFGEEVNHIALSGDGRKLAVAGHWTVTMLDAEQGLEINNWDVQGFNAGATVEKLDLNGKGEQVLIGMTDGAVLSVNLSSGKALKLDHHDNQITVLSYSVDNLWAFSGASDKNFAKWRVDSGEVAFELDFRSRVTAMAYDGKSDKLFVSDALTDHWIVDASSGKRNAKLKYFERFRYFRQALFVEQGQYLVTGSPKEVLTMWRADNGKELASWPIQRYTAEASVWNMAVNDKGELVTLTSDGAVQNWAYRTLLP